MEERARSYLPFLLGIASAVIIIAGMRAIASLLNPILLAVLILFVSLPLTHWLQAKGIRRGLALAITTLTVITIIVGVQLLVGGSLVKMIAGLPAYQASFDAKMAAWESALAARGLDVTGVPESFGVTGAQVMQLVATLVNGLISVLSSVAVVVMYLIFMLIEADDFPAKLRQGLGENPALQQASRFAKRISDFMVIKSWLGFLAALGDVILLLVLGVDYALLWGVLSFMLSFIPSIGYIIALIPPVLVALIQHGPTTALIVFLGYWLINGTVDSVIGPRYLGQSLDLSTVVTIIAAFFWAWVLGPIGALLALPITVAIKMLILEHYPDTHWVAALLAAKVSVAAPGRPRPEPPAEMQAPTQAG